MTESSGGPADGPSLAWIEIAADLATALATSPAARLDEVVTDLLAQVGPSLGAERCYLLRPDRAPGSVRATGTVATHTWTAAGLDPPTGLDVLGSREGELTERLWRGEVLDESTEGPTGSGSLLVVPVATDAVSAALAVEAVTSSRSWDPRARPLLRWAAVTLQSALDRRALEQRVRRAERLETVGRMATGVAHDMNNLLTVVQAASELVQQRVVGTDAVPELAAAVEACRRGAGLTRELLAFASHHVEAPRAVRLDPEVERVVALVSRLVTPRTEVDVDLAAPEAVVLLDPVQLQQVLFNLVLNAHEAMPKGGTVRVSTRAAADHVELTVVDDGPGMEPDLVARALEPFFTTRALSGGTGLGLPTVHDAVDRAGGTFELRSSPGEGTVATVRLPRHAGVVAEPVAGPSTSGDLRGVRILYVEDDTSLSLLVPRLLGSVGAEVEVVADPRLAVAYDAPVDVVVTDVVLPGIPGPELVARLRRHREVLGVVFVSGYSTDTLDPERFPIGDEEFVAKPFGRSDLVDAVRRAAGRR